MTRNVLIADDDPLLRTMLQDALEGSGYQVAVAADGLEAWQKIQVDSPDFLVLDLVMPRLDGARLCRYLKADPRLRSLPVIILSGMAVEASQQLDFPGAEAFIAKRSAPVMIQDVLLTLQALENGGRNGLTLDVQGQTQSRPRQIVVELLAETAHLTAIFQNLGDGILVLDPSGRLLYMNPAGAEILQRSERDLLGTEALAILGAHAEDPLGQALQQLAAQEGSATIRLAYSYREQTLQLTLTNLLERGRVAGHLLILRDVTPFFRRIRELTALNEVAALFTSTLQLDEVLRRVMERIQVLLQAEAGSLLLKDPETDELVFRIALGAHKEAIEGRRLKGGEGIAGWVFREGEPVIIPDVQQDPRFYRAIDAATGFVTRSMLCVPLKARNRVLGVVQVLNSLVSPFFSGEDLSLLSAMAAHAATAIDNALLYEEMAKRNQALRDLLETSQAFGSLLRLRVLLQKIVQKTQELAPAARSGIILFDEHAQSGYVMSRVQGEDVLESEVHLDLTLYPEIQQVIASREPVVVVDALTDTLLEGVRERIAPIGLRSLLVVPLISKGKVIGVLSVGQRGEPKRFTPEEVHLCQILANHASVAIENARLYEQVTRQAAELEQKVQERTQALQAANIRLEAVSRHKSEFLANMSHELRTPLNSIIGFAELLQEESFGPLTAKQARHVENILTSGCHLLALINDLLDLAKVEAGKFELRLEALNLHEVLEAALREVQPQAAAKHLHPSLAVEASLPPLIADPVRVMQILLNVLSNAVKFTPEGGHIAIAARVDGDAVKFTVADTGIGIKPEDLPRLFRPFTQLEPVFTKQHQGTGLGLALTKRLVELHGGELGAESEGEGKGSTFTIRLPLVPPGATHGEMERHEVALPSRL